MPADFMNYLRFLAVFFILSACFSCKTKEVVKPNYPPSAFTVTATLADNGKDIILKWTKSKDPDGDAVTYSIVYKDTLAKNLSDTTYIIKDLPYDTEIKGSVLAKDTKGGSVNSSFSTKTNEDPYVKIPDINFEMKLLELGIDDKQDGLLLKRKAENVTKLRIKPSMFIISDTIKTLEGIEAFTNLKELYCNDLNIERLDVSKNISLSVLVCYFNSIAILDVSKNTNLSILRCGGNRIANLDVSRNLNLDSLSCGGNNLKRLDVSRNTRLAHLECSSNNLETLDIGKNSNLEYLNSQNNPLTNIDVSKNLLLKYLFCSNNQLKKLDISNNKNLLWLDCYDNSLSSLDMANNKKLAILSCWNNSLTNLDISKNVSLRDLFCQYNNIQTICVSNLNQVQNSWQKDPTATYKVCN